MRTFRSFSFGLLALIMGCNDSFAPMPGQDIHLPPFSQQVMELPLLGPGGNFGQSLEFNAPLGVAPIIDIESDSPDVVRIASRELGTIDNAFCDEPCDKTGWRQSVFFETLKAGTAKITFKVHANPHEKSSFKVTVTMSTKG